MTALRDIIHRRIKADGPLPIAEYMSLCLSHPEHGYYTTHDPLGKNGDFTTAPEISQMFGELIGLWLAQAWADRGAPTPFALVELGPGRGTLMADALRAASRVPGFVEAASVWLIETSPALRKKQWEALGKYEPRWASEFSEVPQLPLFLIANEFFDALPIRQFEVREGSLRERVVGLDGDALSLGLSPPVSEEPLPDHAEDGTIVETCPAGRSIAAEIGDSLNRNGGAALIVDYGHDTASPRGDTLQAMKDHSYTDILAEPGSVDLTAHVDFRTLANSAETAGATSWGVRTQGALLDWLGIRVRAAMLAKTSSGREAEIQAALDRLTEPEQMGTLFKALALTGDDVDPPGFSEELGA